ncbi:Spy0128 family protein [Enorma sp.]|uniref:Spy0128 family protein n=1 Tax=Enorma sp. TaxID=1920692 RepID=UPI003AB778C5
MSSNYPNATENDRNRLGQRAENTQGEDSYYKAATDAESLNQVFEQIADDMQTGSVGVPTQIDNGFNMGNDGYITFTDTLGAYMEVNPDQDFTVVYKNTPYTATYDADSGTYTMPNMPVEGNYADRDENLTNINQILISVEKSNNYALEGDTVTVQVPASLIPLLHYSVTTENGETVITNDSEETFPIRALYGVRVVDNIDDIMIEQLADEDSALNNYLDGNGNTSADGTQAYLYSNNWQRPATADGTTATGSTTATFEPSTKNAFYYFQEDTPVYTDEACTQPARQDDLSGDGSLYYKFTYDVAGTDGEGWYAIEVPVSNFVNHPDYYGVKRNYDQLNNDEIVNGQVYIKTGMPRLSRVNDFNTAKADGANKTNTATQVLRPSWTNNDQAVSVALGNNGRIAIEMPGSLAISKNVETPEGFPTDDVTYHEGVDFEFKIHVDGASGEYTAAIAEDGKTTPIDGGITFSDSGDATYKLHDGQQLIIYGLDNGANYTVTETEKDGYEATSEGATGTIKAAETAQAAFTNTYVVTPATVTGSTDLKGTKSIDGRTWVDGEKYVFYLAPLTQGNPMPTDAENGRAEATVTGDSSKGENAIGFNFGDIEFKMPGVYNYTIQEDASKSDDMPGVTQSQAAYRVQITVEDNHDGSLKATVKMFQSRTDDNAVIDEANWTETDTAAFVNRYEVGAASAPIYATKAITDEVGSNKKVENGDYRFILEPAGDTAETAPMPANATGEGASRQALSVNQGERAAFSIPFTNDDFPTGENEATFWYKLTEDDSYEPIPGMDYSTQEFYVKVMFERSEDADGGALIKPTVTYYTDADGTQPADNNQALFTNTFDPDDVTLGEDGATDIHGTKTVDGRDWNGDSYTFTIAEAEGHEGQDGMKMPDDCTATVADTDHNKVEGMAYPFSFKGITFSKVGDYYFTITETGTPGDDKGMTYDDHKTNVIVTVGVDAENGKLQITKVTYDNEGVVGASTAQAEYTNTYHAMVDFGDGAKGGIQVTKEMTGRTAGAGEFSFTVKGIDGTDTTAAEANAMLESGDRLFGNSASNTMQLFMGDGFKFDQDDAGKTFSFVVDELSSQDEITAANSQQTLKPNVTYDPASYRVDLTVVDDGDGSMHVETTITPCDASGAAMGDVVYTGSTDDADYAIPTVTFRNSYAPDSASYDTTNAELLNKVIDGRAWLASDEFEFTIAADDSVEGNLASDAMPTETTVKLSGADYEDTPSDTPVSFGFGTLTFSKPGTYVYKVTEANAGTTEGGLTYSDNVATLKFVVEDNPATGDLEVKNADIVTNGTFTNTYEASVDYSAVGGMNIKKTLDGHALAEDQFTFEAQIIDENGDAQGKPVEWKNPAPTSGTSTATWNPFENGWTFDQDDAGNTIRFTVTEKNDGADGYTYDGAKYTVEVTPIDNDDGTMSVHTKVTKEGVDEPIFDKTTSADSPETAVLGFTNTYGTDATTDDVAADIDATKTLTGRDMTEGEFSFEIVTREADGFGGEFTPATVATGTNAAANDGEAGDVAFTGTDGAMTYTIAKLDQAVADGYATKSVGDNGNATWTLNYTARELTDKLPTNVTAEDPKSFEFTVTVVDNGDGTLEATVNAPQGGIAFKNTYKPDDVTVGADGDAKITVQKTFTGRANNAWLESDSFEFTIAAQTDGAPMPENATVEVTNDDNAVVGVAGAYTDIFGNITYTKADLDGAMLKDFVYTITETSPASDGNGITKDTHTAKVTVTVTDNGEGQLVAEVTYDNGDAKPEADQQVDNAAAFTNTYEASEGGTLDGSTYLKASKTLTGRDWQEGEQVDIVLRGDKGTPAPEGTPDTDDARWTYAMHVSEDGSFTFPDIKYTAADLGGEDSAQFTYVIRELSDTHTIVYGTEADEAQIRQGMDYALDTYRVVVTVRDAHNGTLDVSAQMYHVRDHDGDYVTGDATEELVADNTAAFENRFDASTESIELTAKKDYNDPNNGKPMTDDMFSFRVTAVGDEAATAPMGGREQTDGEGNRYIDASVDAETKDASFGTAKFQFDGQNHTFYYEVTENMPAGANEGNGYKVDGVTYDPTVFTVKVEVTYDDQADKSNAGMSIFKGSYDEVSQADADALDAMKVDGITFENSYGTGGTTVDTGDAKTTANFTKVIDGRDWLDTDSFQFTITPQDDAPAFDGAGDGGVKTVDVTADNPVVDKTTGIDGTETEVYGRSFNFGSVTFTDEDMTGAIMVDGKLTKTFTYKVNEVAPPDGDKIPGMNYDTIHEATLTITVVDNGDGTMIATPQVTNDVFLNTYIASVDGTAFGGFQITKTLTGHDMTAGQFEFTVEPVNGTNTTADDAAAKLGITGDNGTVASPAADDSQTVTVGTFDLADGMKFTQDDAGKTFVYEVSETKRGGTGYTNDDATYRVEIAVEHNAATATLTVTTTVYKGDEQVGEPVVVTNATAERATASVDFKNSYSATTETEGGASATVSTTKTLEGRPLEAGEFTFQVAYAAGDKDVVDGKGNVTNAADGTVDFGSFDYTTEMLADMVQTGYTQKVTNEDGLPSWTIQYTASEVTDGLPAEGVTASKTSFDFTITVVDNGDGTLTATASLPDNHGFENTYSTNDGNPVSVTPTGNKVFDHAEGLEPDIAELAGAYTFTLEPVTEGAPMPEGDGNVTTNDAQGNVTFGAIEFTLDDLNNALAAQKGGNAEEGVDTQELDGQPREFTFEYQVTEAETNPGAIDYVTVDTEPKTIKYTVHDDGQGTLTVTSDPANAPLFSFTNTYTVEPEPSSPTGEGQLTITKMLIGRDMVAGEFTVTLTAAADGTEYKATIAAAADGKPGAVTFDAITFDTPGTYQYTLAEQPGAGNVGIDYDTDTYTVTADVKDNGQGGLEVTWSINGTQDKTVAFENTYEATPASMSFGASKVLTGRDLEDGEFSFQVTDETGEALYANGTNDAAGTVNFDPITFNQAGTYHLWISEVLPEDDDAETEGIQSENVTYDETRYELVVTVEDNGKGSLVVTDVTAADGSEPVPVFENVYTEPVEPVLPGGDSLEQTGDTMPIAMGTVAVAGVALVAGGLVVRRKHGE